MNIKNIFYKKDNKRVKINASKYRHNNNKTSLIIYTYLTVTEQPQPWCPVVIVVGDVKVVRTCEDDSCFKLYYHKPFININISITSNILG